MSASVTSVQKEHSQEGASHQVGQPLMEARWCREARARGTAFSESKWGPESPQLESETGTDTGTEQNGLEGSGPSELCIALRNCRESTGD